MSGSPRRWNLLQFLLRHAIRYRGLSLTGTSRSSSRNCALPVAATNIWLAFSRSRSIRRLRWPDRAYDARGAASPALGAIFAGQLAVCLALAAVARSLIAGRPSLAREVRVPPPAARAQIAFACEMDTPELQLLFANPDVLRDLHRLNAGISVSLIDLSPGRAAVVRRLNAAHIPVTAWMSLPKEQGYYLNSSNASQAITRFADFQKWTAAYGLVWSGIGLDIEPNLQEFAAARQGAPLLAAASIFRRLFDPGIVQRARRDYAGLIAQMHSAGYKVDTYQFPFIADERAVKSTLLKRLFGIVDVHGDREALMLYSSFNHRADSAVIWQYGPSAQLIVVGSVAGERSPARNSFR